MNLVHYNSGNSILKTIYSFMKTTITYNQFYDGLQMTHYGEKIPSSEFQEWVAGLGYIKENFLKIVWKSNNDFTDILKKIAAKIPSGKLPTRLMITDAFLYPDTFKASFLDVAMLTTRVTASAAKSVVNKTVDVANFLTNYKGPILVLVGGFVLLKLLKQSDKIKSAYNRVTSDAAKAYKNVKSSR
jgi:hypothetical protein